MTLPDNTTNSASRRVVYNPYTRKRPRTDSSTPSSNVEHSFESVQRQSLARAPTGNPQSTDNYNNRPLHSSSAQVPSGLSANHWNSTTTNNSYKSNRVSHVDALPLAPEGRVNAASAAAAKITRPDDGHKCDNKRDSLESLDDSSIDWEEAIRVTDSAAQVFVQSPGHEAVLAAAAMPTSPSTNRLSANQALDSSLTVVDLAQKAVSSGPTASNHGQAIASPLNPSISPAKKPPRLPPAGRQHPRNMASLRPATWSNNGADNGQGNQKGEATAAASPQEMSQHQGPGHGQVVASPSAKLHPSIQALPKELRFSPEVIQSAKDGRTQELVKHAQLGQPLANGWTLYDHQKRAICMGLRMRRAIIGLDMGLGKTLIGCVWARSFHKTFSKCKIVIICPVSLKQEWARTAVQATEMQVKEEVSKTKTNKKQKASKKNASSGVNANGGSSPGASSTAMLEICSWSKVPTAIESTVDNYVVVADEAHMIQSMEAARTQNFLTLVTAHRCIGVLLLTGTPMKNGRPSNLFPLLRACRHPFGRNQRAYETHFCAGREIRTSQGPVWLATGGTNLAQLGELVSSHLLYLKKEECLKSLPELTREFRPVPVSYHAQKSYDDQMKEVRALHAAHVARESDNQDALMGAITTLRCAGAYARIDASVEIAMQILQKEPAIVIFTSFVKVAKAIHQKLDKKGWAGELLTGETPAIKRQAMVDNFQSGVSPVFVCTFGAGGVGITLTAARTLILVDRPWTPGDVFQAEDRVRRIGQTHPVKFIWLSSFELDRHMDSIIESKSKTSNAVLMDGNNGLNAAPPSISIFQLLAKMVDAGRSNTSGCSTSASGGMAGPP